MHPEIWASPEPTVARIDRGRYRDQLHESGHERRDDDIDRLAALGVAASRYPVLWEKVAPDHPDSRDYTWAARRLDALRDAGVEPIVTLLHHGSGPQWTDLLDPEFPFAFARYAAATARRFPWIRRWTLINEPLTTARFSALYGAWYPNRTDDRAFGRAIVNEVRAIAMATELIRDVIPHATFLLTEDAQAFTAADDGVAAYVEHKRERMFLSCELLQGRIADGHPMHRYLTERCGISTSELRALEARPAPPDVMGWNYYPNSERWLASDGRGIAANIALVDVSPHALDLQRILTAAHERLALPFALSEVHVRGNEYERARWMLQRFEDASELQARGIPIVAFGAWAAFGMADWTSLLRERNGDIEDGVYAWAGLDGVPQPTLVADVVRELAAGRVPHMPVTAGWWERGRADVA